MSLAALLWEANRDLATAAREHPFVRGLEDGSLPEEKFRYYVGQDAFFLNAFARAYALAAAKSDGPALMARFARLLQGVLDELQLHRKYAADLGIDLAAVEPGPATRAYTDFVQRVAWSEPVGEICAALTPCMRLYAHLGRELAGSGPHEHRYADWIRTYGSDEFEQLAATLEELLEGTAGGGRGAAAAADVAGAYRYAMRLEVNFFEDAWQAGR